MLINLLAFSIKQADAFDETSYDLVIVNARIVDGTENPWFRGSIAVKDGRIVKVGRVNAANATQTIDADNKIVAPGFIDVHTHVEGIYINPTAEFTLRISATKARMSSNQSTKQSISANRRICRLKFRISK